MNERIQELVEQAKCCEDGVNWIIDQEKFAELIILECACIPNWCIETGKDQLVETMFAERLVKNILEHFGVDE